MYIFESLYASQISSQRHRWYEAAICILSLLTRGSGVCIVIYFVEEPRFYIRPMLGFDGAREYT